MNMILSPKLSVDGRGCWGGGFNIVWVKYISYGADSASIGFPAEKRTHGALWKCEPAIIVFLHQNASELS